MRVCFSIPALQDPPWFSLLFRPCVTTFQFLGPLMPCSCLAIYILPFCGTGGRSLKGKGRRPLWRRGALGSLCLFSARMHLWREMRAHGMTGWLVSASSGCWPENILVKLSLGDLLYSRRNKLNKKVKDIWPKDE